MNGYTRNECISMWARPIFTRYQMAFPFNVLVKQAGIYVTIFSMVTYDICVKKLIMIVTYNYHKLALKSIMTSHNFHFQSIIYRQFDHCAIETSSTAKPTAALHHLWASDKPYPLDPHQNLLKFQCSEPEVLWDMNFTCFPVHNVLVRYVLQHFKMMNELSLETTFLCQ